MLENLEDYGNDEVENERDLLRAIWIRRWIACLS